MFRKKRRAVVKGPVLAVDGAGGYCAVDGVGEMARERERGQGQRQQRSINNKVGSKATGEDADLEEATTATIKGSNNNRGGCSLESSE